MEIDDNVDRLEGTSGLEVGGLVVKKKPQVEHEFKKPDLPKLSLLGLDRLAGRYFVIVIK